MMSKYLFMMMLLICQGEEHKLAVNSSLIPCYIKQNNAGSLNDTGRSYKVSIYTSWMRHIGCLYRDSLKSLELNKQSLDYNSPGRCSLFCDLYQQFAVQINWCVCLEVRDLSAEHNTNNCKAPCPDNSSTATCGTDDNFYFDVYKHPKDVKTVDQNKVDTECMIARKDDVNIMYEAVSCFDRYDGYFLLTDGDIYTSSNITKSQADNLKYKLVEGNKQLPKNIFVWTPFIRSHILILESKNMVFNNSSCQLEKGHNWSTARLLLNVTGDIHLQCILGSKLMCYVHDVVYETGTTIPPDSKYTFVQQDIITEKGLINTTLSTEAESLRLSTTDTTFLFEKSVFPLQIGIAVGVSCMVILCATLSCCFNKPKRGQYTFPISRSEENIVMATEGPPQQTIPSAVLAENYSEPKDKTFSSSEMEGPRFCATTPCQKTSCQKNENVEYHHLDFTLRSETTPRFADNNEYDHVRANTVSVFDQPWDTATSKVNKLFSQISKSVVQKGQTIRKSLIKRHDSRSGSPKLKCRSSEYCEAWKTQLNNKQFVLDSDVDNQSDISIDETNSTVDSNRDKPELRRTDSVFPVLPYSERINVKSTHIYDEQDDRRMSLRERLLHMISIRPLKMPFGIELDLRASRSKSKIYSLATSIEEIDESVA